MQVLTSGLEMCPRWKGGSQVSPAPQPLEGPGLQGREGWVRLPGHSSRTVCASSQIPLCSRPRPGGEEANPAESHMGRAVKLPSFPAPKLYLSPRTEPLPCSLRGLREVGSSGPKKAEGMAQPPGPAATAE